MSIHDFERGLRKGIELGESRGKLKQHTSQLVAASELRGWTDIADSVRSAQEQINGMSENGVKLLLLEEKERAEACLNQDSGSGI